MIDTDLFNALSESQIRLHVFVSVALDSGTIYLWDGVGDSPELNGNIYKGFGTFGRVDFGQDSLSRVARPFSMTLSGSYIDEDGNPTEADGFADAVGQTLQDEPLQGREITVSVALTDLNGVSILHTTVDRARGRIDAVQVNEDDNGFLSLTINVEDSTLRFAKVNPRRLSLATHQKQNPDSTFMAQVAQLRTKQTLWGVKR